VTTLVLACLAVLSLFCACRASNYLLLPAAVLAGLASK
jgi:hypothetical protein